MKRVIHYSKFLYYYEQREVNIDRILSHIQENLTSPFTLYFVLELCGTF